MKKKIIGIAIAALIVLTAAAILVLKLISEYKAANAPSEVVKPLNEYYSVADGEAMVIIDEKVYEKAALWSSDTAYLDLDTVRSMYNHRFFWTEAENLMIYTTPDKVYHFTPGERNYEVNTELTSAEAPVVEVRGGVPYISVNFLENCGITYRIYNDPNRVMITYSDEAYLTAPVAQASQIRTGQDIKDDIVRELAEGETVRFIDGGGIRENGFVKVMSEDGVRGYVLESALAESGYTDPVFADYTREEYTHITRDEKIYLGWQLIYRTDNTDMLESDAADVPELTVVAPTWFFLTGTAGDMMSYANNAYVTRAHELGLEVWATYKNDSNDSFSCTEDTHTLLTSTTGRGTLVSNIMSTVDEFGLDGVNIDFEMLKVDSGIYFIQFLRELSVRCREKGVVLSVDNYVPENYNAYYDLPEQSEIVDYIIIMGYDEHYAGSEEAGSVSSLGWFKNAVSGTAAKADPSRVIMGVPFYTRLWEIKEDGGVYVEETPDMAGADRIVQKSGVEAEWNESMGQYFAEWNSGSSRFKIWLEEAESLKCKTYAAREYDMAGIAAWKLGDETPGTWTAIKDAFEGEIPVDEPEEDEESSAEQEGEGTAE